MTGASTNYSPNHSGARNCFRCQKPLTDAASLNEGVGPICRKLDNALLAQLIPSSLSEALKSYATVQVLRLHPETVPTFVSLEGSLREDDASNRSDWRKQVKQIEWMLSYLQHPSNVEALKGIALALGYVGLVSLWNGEASTGKAQASFESGRLVIRGPRNKAASWGFKKIAGAAFVSPVYANSTKGGWSVPAAQADAFMFAVTKYYPNFEGLSAAIEAAKAYVASPEGQALAQATKPVATLAQLGDTLKVRTPYKDSFIVALKLALPYSARKWNAAEKVWEVTGPYRTQLEALLTEHFQSWAEAA